MTKGKALPWGLTGALLALTLAAAVASASTAPGRNGPTGHLSGAGEPLTATQGTVVFSDNFNDPRSGWLHSTFASSGTTFAYRDGNYVITPRGSLIWFAYAPFTKPERDMSAAVTGTLNIFAPFNAGFGVSCFRGFGTSTLSIHFLDVVNEPGVGVWYIVEQRGSGPSAQYESLESDIAPVPPTSTATTITGVCGVLSEKGTTHLQMFVNGREVANLTRTLPTTGTGWTSGIDAAGGGTLLSRVTVSHFVERAV